MWTAPNKGLKSKLGMGNAASAGSVPSTEIGDGRQQDFFPGLFF
jgi:hypothetical protein